MSRLVFVTQQVDPNHPALGATVAKVAALAERVDEVCVVADSAVAGALPANCRVRSFRAGTKLGRGLRFEAALARELRPRPLAVLAHMCPIYAVLAAPLARPLRIPIALWYTHWRASRTLGAAERVASVVLSVDRRSFPLDSPKVRAIGHGIDSSDFPCVARSDTDGDVRVLAVGRYSPAKGLDVVLRAIARTPSARLEVHGPVLSELEREHRRELGRLVRELGVSDRVVLGEPLPRAELADLYGRSDVLVNNMRAGAPDKVVYEAAASCLPVLASNPVFDGFLPPEFRFRRDDPDELAERLSRFASLDPGARAAVGRKLRERVEREHDVGGWADRVLEAVRRR